VFRRWSYGYGMAPSKARSQPEAGARRVVGRRKGESRTREDILDAALLLFSEQGYDGASVRAIAQQAEVDPALIRHFFTNKEMLFAAVMADRTDIPTRLSVALTGPTESLGTALTDAYLRVWDDADTQPILLGILRSAMSTEQSVEILVGMINAQLRQLTQTIDDDGDLRSGFSLDESGFALAVAQLFGIAMTRHVLRLPALVQMPHDELVTRIAPTVQRYLTGSDG